MMQSPGIVTDKGKAKAQDAEFEAAFARFEEITQEKEKDAGSVGTNDMDVYVFLAVIPVSHRIEF